MYRRYSQANGTGLSMSQMKHSRIRDLVILVLAGLLVASLVLGIPAMLKQTDVRTLYIQRIQAECDDAIRLTSTLSRNAGADSASILARVRSSLYAIRMISNLNAAEGGGPLVEDERILTLQNTVDRYLTYLTTGMDTGEYQTGLQTSLEELQETLSGLT